MLSFQACGVPTQWPFKPYDQQLEYCKSVIAAIQKRQNAVLESPTGTGKTISLLVSSLAWQQGTSESGLIYYLSRTHIQLSQAAKEMKKTAYSRVPAVVLASRKHLCLNSEVQEQSHGIDVSMNRACQNAIAKNSCVYFTNYEEKLKARLNINKVHDIEDLHHFGRVNQCCPFYASKKIAETQAAIVFMPYNYVLDLSVRKSASLKLDKSVLIIDEGHNIESSLKECASAKITMHFLKVIQESCEKVPHKLSDALMRDVHGLSRRKTSVLDDVANEKETSKKKKKTEDKPSMIEELAAKLTTDKLQQVNRCAKILMSCQDLLKTREGRYEETKCDIELLKKKLDEAGVNFSTSDAIIETLDNIATFWSIIGVVNPQTISRYIGATTSLSHFISLIYPSGTKNLPKFDQHLTSLKQNYSAYMLPELERDTILQKSNKLINWEMNLWCLNPGVGLRRVIDESCMTGPRSIIITSGTLAPIDLLVRDLGRKFEIIKEFGHLIRDDQMKITILSKSPSDYSLDTKYQNTQDPKCLNAIGETLSSLLGVLPFGTLVFFPSYRLMQMVLRYCDNKPFWKALTRATNLFQESQNQSSFTDDMMKFKKIVDASGRAAFMGVCRGKLSEGTNLEKNHCRSVVIVGLPFPHRGDAQIKETLSFHDRRGDKNGEVWYTSQMRRALGQAIGRVIRSKDDFGMVFLCDPRFTMFKMSISKWVQKYYPDHATVDFRQVAKDIKEFFNRYDIDIAASSLARVSVSQDSGAFEFDHSTRRKNPKPAKIINYAPPQPFQQTNRDVDIVEVSVVQPADPKIGPRTMAQRQAEMVAAYTVDRETFERVTQSRKRPEPEQPPVVKKPRSNQEVVETLFATQTNTPPPPPSSSSSSSPPPPPPMLTTAEPQTKLTQSKHLQKVRAKCFVCLNDPQQPYLTNCKCSRMGCLTCLKGLNKKTCGECGSQLKLKCFKPKLFNMFKKN